MHPGILDWNAREMNKFKYSDIVYPLNISPATLLESRLERRLHNANIPNSNCWLSGNLSTASYDNEITCSPSTVQLLVSGVGISQLSRTGMRPHGVRTAGIFRGRRLLLKGTVLIFKNWKYIFDVVVWYLREALSQSWIYKSFSWIGCFLDAKPPVRRNMAPLSIRPLASCTIWNIALLRELVRANCFDSVLRRSPEQWRTLFPASCRGCDL